MVTLNFNFWFVKFEYFKHLFFQNPNGFKIFKKICKAEKRFIADKFKLPQFVNFGEWRILAFVKNSIKKFETYFKVLEYGRNFFD